MHEHALEALLLEAGLAVVLEQDVRRAHEPVLVGRVELDPAAHPKHLRSADQRDVVEVHDVVALLEHLRDLLALEPGRAGLLGQEGRQDAGRGS